MTVTPERAKVLDFTTPYYYTPASYAVNKDNTTITGVDRSERQEDRRVRLVHLRGVSCSTS